MLPPFLEWEIHTSTDLHTTPVDQSVFNFGLPGQNLNLMTAATPFQPSSNQFLFTQDDSFAAMPTNGSNRGKSSTGDDSAFHSGSLNEYNEYYQ